MIPLGALASARVTAVAMREFLAEAHNGVSASGAGRVNFRPDGGFQISSTDRFGADASIITASLRNGGGLIVENVTTGVSRKIIGAFAINTAYDFEYSTWWNIVSGVSVTAGDIIRLTYWTEPALPWSRASLGTPHRRTFTTTVAANGGHGIIWHWSLGPMISNYPVMSNTEGIVWASTTSPTLVGKTLKVQSVADPADTYSGTITKLSAYAASERIYLTLSPALSSSRFPNGTLVDVWYEG